MDFQLVTGYKPRGDQPRAIDQIMEGLAGGEQHQMLLCIIESTLSDSHPIMVGDERFP
jgi:excinuclease ABC subunit B